MNKIGFAVVLILFVMILVSIGSVTASNWTVNPGGSIQSAINNASVNDTIIVSDNNGTTYA